MAKKKLHFDQLLMELHQRSLNCQNPDDLDFYTLLQQMSEFYERTDEELMLLGFRKAYRQAIEGV